MAMHRDAEMDAALLPMPTALALATTAAADCLGIAGLGSIAVGQPADLVLLDTANVRYALRPGPLDALRDVATAGDVTTVIVGGTPLLDAGTFVSLDEATTMAAARAAIAG